MLDKDLFLSICQEYHVELSTTAIYPVTNEKWQDHTITNNLTVPSDSLNYCVKGRPVLHFYWVETPKIVRILSDSLALDHTFFPESCDHPIGIEDLQILLLNPMIDEIYVFLKKRNKAYYIDTDGTHIPLKGWVALASFSVKLK